MAKILFRHILKMHNDVDSEGTVVAKVAHHVTPTGVAAVDMEFDNFLSSKDMAMPEKS
jgi:hypothetical protein